jgi:flagellar protein FliO/FliZ
MTTVLFQAAEAWAAGLDVGGDPQLWPLMLKMLAALGLVVGLMFLLSAGLRRARLVRSRTGEEMIKIKETRPLGAKKMLCLIEVRGQEILLGITSERIDFLSHVGNEETSSPSFAQEMNSQSQTRS